ncbi:eukaryotic translation initiation factor 3 subunit J-like protein [Tanacetum coccineum]
MEDWEDEPAPLVVKKEPKSMWDDEDVDASDIKDSWEDEDEPTLQPVAWPLFSKKPKVPKKPKPKSVQEKGKLIEVAKEEQLDHVAKKLRQQRLVEEADYKNTAAPSGVYY